MKITRIKEKGRAEIDVTSFSDIAFLLIIFFIVATTFAGNFGNQLNVPSGTSDAEKKEKQQLTINLRPGQINYGEKGQTVTMEQLRELLQTEKFAERKPEKRMVIVECTKDVPYQEYFEVIMAISSSGGVLALVEEDNREARSKLQ